MTIRMTRKTRKRRYASMPTLHLTPLKKTKGGRIENMNTFKTVCSPDQASAKLVGVKSLKTPEESDDFVHVLKSVMKGNEGQDLIVKVQEPGRMLSMELEIQKLLTGCNNVIQYICDFECMFDNIVWSKPLDKPRHFCDNKGERMHVIVMEYINNDLSSFMESIDLTNVKNRDIMNSIILQTGLSLLDMHINYKVCHNDINRGNILLDVGIPKTLTYTVGGNTMDVSTLGHEVVYIDFQRGNIIESSAPNNETGNIFNPYNINIANINDDSDASDNSVLVQLAVDEISLLYELMSKWTNNAAYKTLLRGMMNDILLCTTVDELFAAIVKTSK